jgi:hypothetical protein
VAFVSLRCMRLKEPIPCSTKRVSSDVRSPEPALLRLLRFDIVAEVLKAVQQNSAPCKSLLRPEISLS